MASISFARTILFSHLTKFFFFPSKPYSSSFSSPPLQFTRTTCTLHLSHTPSEPPKHQPFLRRNVLEILEERGLLESLTSDSLRGSSSDPIASPLKVYCGFDPTAESLHLGNLLGIIVLSWFSRCGHNVVALLGGATARVGDPSGKSLERPELDVDTLEKNTVSITNTIRRVLGGAQNQNLDEFNVNVNLSDSSLVILNNYDWWKEFSLLDFLKRVGRYARVGLMANINS